MTLPPEPAPADEDQEHQDLQDHPQTDVPEGDVASLETAPAAPVIAPPVKPEPAAAAVVRKTVAAAKTAPAPARLTSDKSKKKSRKKRDCRPDIPEITRGSGRQDYAVNRGLIDRYAKDLSAAADLAYVAWARDDDERVIGFKVIRIRCGSPLHEAGFKNGDVITRINGHKVRTVPQALAAYVALRIKRKLRVRGQRKDGSEMDMRYRLT
jgi:hypothetical protein